MDYESVWRALCRNVDDRNQGKKTKEECEEYKRGVFDCLFHLDLVEEYYDWCESKDIPVVEDTGDDDEDESYLGYL